VKQFVLVLAAAVRARENLVLAPRRGAEMILSIIIVFLKAIYSYRSKFEIIRNCQDLYTIILFGEKKVLTT